MPSPKKPSRKVAGEADPGPKDEKQIHARIDRAGWEALRDFASIRNLSVEALMVEALNDYLKRHKQPGEIQRRTGADPSYASEPSKSALTDPITGQVSLPLGAPGKLVGKRRRAT